MRTRAFLILRACRAMALLLAVPAMATTPALAKWGHGGGHFGGHWLCC